MVTRRCSERRFFLRPDEETNNAFLYCLIEAAQHANVHLVLALLEKRPLRARRPKFFRADAPMPEFVEMTPTIPPELGDPDEVIAELKRRIAEVEEMCARERQRTGRQVVGRRRALRQSWRDSPTSHEPRRNLRSRVAARSKWRRIERLQTDKAWLLEYREVRPRWLAGERVEFPPGTYWLARFANVQVRGLSRPPPTQP